MNGFDPRTAKLLKPGEHITIDDCPGLRLEASTKWRSWIYRYKSPVNGRMKQFKIGVWPTVSVAGAIVAWEGLKARRDAGEDPASEKKAVIRKAKVAKERASRVPTVRDVCDQYVEEFIQSHRNAKGAAEVTRLLSEKYIPSEFADLAAESVTRTQAFDLIQSQAATTPVLAKQIRQELGAAWDHALDAGRLPATVPNWWRLILKGKIKSKGKKIAGKHIGTAKRWLKDHEVGELIDWMGNFTEVVADVLILYLWTGDRGAEIVTMEGREVTEEADGWWWTVPKAKTKNARHPDATDLRVPLIGRALEIVLRRKKKYGDGWLFPAKKRDGKIGPVEQKYIQSKSYYHQPYCVTRPQYKRPRLTVTHWAPHDLRRTARTCLSKLGCPEDVAEAAVGHMQEGVKGVYNMHQYDAERRIWLTRLADHWESVHQSTIALHNSAAEEGQKSAETLPIP